MGHSQIRTEVERASNAAVPADPTAPVSNPEMLTVQSCAARLADCARFLGDLACLMAWNGGNTQRLSGESVAISGAVEELARTIDHIADAASDTRDQSADASAIVSQTVTQAAEAGEAIQAIASSFTDIRSRTELLGGAIRSIGDMAREIDSISKQTKLLSLNATIEAARAGDAGRGFGVVAAEVKALSEQTAKTTEDIGAKLAELDQVIAGVSLAVDTGGARVDAGTKAFETVSGNMDRVAERVCAADARIDTISHSLNEQKEATTSIAKSLAEVARLATQNDTDGKTAGAVLADAQSTAMSLLKEVEANGAPAAPALAAELAHWRGLLAQRLVGATAEPVCERPPFDAVPQGLAPALGSAIAGDLSQCLASARQMGMNLKAHDMDGAIAAYVAADEKINLVIQRLVPEARSALAS